MSTALPKNYLSRLMSYGRTSMQLKADPGSYVGVFQAGIPATRSCQPSKAHLSSTAPILTVHSLLLAVLTATQRRTCTCAVAVVRSRQRRKALTAA